MAFYRKRSGERLVPLTKTHQGLMTKLYDSTCIIEVPYRIGREWTWAPRLKALHRWYSCLNEFDSDLSDIFEI